MYQTGHHLISPSTFSMARLVKTRLDRSFTAGYSGSVLNTRGGRQSCTNRGYSEDARAVRASSKLNILWKKTKKRQGNPGRLRLQVKTKKTDKHGTLTVTGSNEKYRETQDAHGHRSKQNKTKQNRYGNRVREQEPGPSLTGNGEIARGVSTFMFHPQEENQQFLRVVQARKKEKAEADTFRGSGT